MAQIYRTLRAHPGPSRQSRCPSPAAPPDGAEAASPQQRPHSAASGSPQRGSARKHRAWQGRASDPCGAGDSEGCRRRCRSRRRARLRAGADGAAGSGWTRFDAGPRFPARGGTASRPGPPSVPSGVAPRLRGGPRCPRATSRAAQGREARRERPGASPAWSSTSAAAEERRHETGSAGRLRASSARIEARTREGRRRAPSGLRPGVREGVGSTHGPTDGTGVPRGARGARQNVVGVFTGHPSASRPAGAPPARARSALSRPRAAPAAAPADGAALPKDVSVLPGLFYLSYTDDTNGQKPKHFSMEQVLV